MTAAMKLAEFLDERCALYVKSTPYRAALNRERPRFNPRSLPRRAAA